MLHIGMWVFKSLYSDTATIYYTADVECRFVTELHLFQEMIIGSLVTVNRNQSGACDLHPTIDVPFGCLSRIPQTVVFDIDSSLAAVGVVFFRLCRKLARTRSTSSSAVNGRPLDFCLHRHPVSVNCLYHARMVLSIGGVLCVLCTKCTLHSNHRLIRVIFQHTKLLFPQERPFSHYIDSYRLAAEMRTTIKKTYCEKKIQLFLLSALTYSMEQSP